MGGKHFLLDLVTIEWYSFYKRKRVMTDNDSESKSDPRADLSNNSSLHIEPALSSLLKSRPSSTFLII